MAQYTDSTKALFTFEMSYSAVFTKLTNTQHNYMQIFYAEFHRNRAVNV
jgi:hypothetical protein